jgi:hypothetical protein
VRERIERDASELPRGRIPQPVGRHRVRRFVKRQGNEKNRQPWQNNFERQALKM